MTGFSSGKVMVSGRRSTRGVVGRGWAGLFEGLVVFCGDCACGGGGLASGATYTISPPLGGRAFFSGRSGW